MRFGHWCLCSTPLFCLWELIFSLSCSSLFQCEFGFALHGLSHCYRTNRRHLALGGHSLPYHLCLPHWPLYSAIQYDHGGFCDNLTYDTMLPMELHVLLTDWKSPKDMTFTSASLSKGPSNAHFRGTFSPLGWLTAYTRHNICPRLPVIVI